MRLMWPTTSPVAAAQLETERRLVPVVAEWSNWQVFGPKLIPVRW